LGRQRSPLAQGRVTLEATGVAIDVSKHRLDVAISPSDEPGFAVARDAAWLDALAARLKPLGPAAIAVAATGGF
jgi:hypothetical protein